MKHLQTPPCYIICLLLSCKKVNRTTQRRSEDQLMDRRVFTRILGLHRYLILSLVRPQLHCTLFIIIYKKMTLNIQKYIHVYVVNLIHKSCRKAFVFSDVEHVGRGDSSEELWSESFLPFLLKCEA